MARAALNIEITGVKDAFNKFKGNFNKIADEIDMEMGDGIERIVTQAKTLVPANFSRLRSSLYVTKLGKYNYEFGSNVNYAAYVEFGTGKYAASYVPSLEPEWQRFALTYKTANPGKLPSSPYLYPSIILGQQNIIKNINQIVKKYA
jgi:hypothetical protein